MIKNTKKYSKTKQTQNKIEQTNKNKQIDQNKTKTLYIYI